MATRPHNLSISRLADEAVRYVCRCGEGHPDAPVTEAITFALLDYDGSTSSEDYLWAQYRAAFEDAPASIGFRAYVEEGE